MSHAIGNEHSCRVKTNLELRLLLFQTYEHHKSLEMLTYTHSAIPNIWAIHMCHMSNWKHISSPKFAYNTWMCPSHYAWGMSHTWIRHLLRRSLLQKRDIKYRDNKKDLNASFALCLRHVTHANESCLIWIGDLLETPMIETYKRDL